MQRMSDCNFQIYPVDKDLLIRVLPLIADYQIFYGATPDHQKNQSFFGSFPKFPDRAIQFAAVDSQRAVLGFTTLYFILSSLSAQPCCILNDLYTVPESRGKGVARALLKHARAHAKAQGYASVEWMTQKENASAQRLYDSLPVNKSEWFYYSWPT